MFPHISRQSPELFLNGNHFACESTNYSPSTEMASVLGSLARIFSYICFRRGTTINIYMCVCIYCMICMRIYQKSQQDPFAIPLTNNPNAWLKMPCTPCRPHPAFVDWVLFWPAPAYRIVPEQPMGGMDDVTKGTKIGASINNYKGTTYPWKTKI